MEVWFLMTQKSLMIRKSFIILSDLSNESVEFDDPKGGDDPQISDEPKEISIGGMDLDLLIHKSTVMTSPSMVLFLNLSSFSNNEVWF